MEIVYSIVDSHRRVIYQWEEVSQFFILKGDIDSVLGVKFANSTVRSPDSRKCKFVTFFK